MKELISREDIKNIIIKTIENRFDEDTKNTILKSKPFDGEDTYIYKDLNLDSLDIIEFIIETEYEINYIVKTYNKEKIHVDDDFINEELTIGSLIDHLYKKINKSNHKEKI